MVIITGPQGKPLNNKKCMTRHLKRDFKCIYFSFIYAFIFLLFFIYLHILDIKKMWLSIWTGCGLRGRKEMMSVITVPPNRIAKTTTKQDLPFVCYWSDQ